ncbi:hypothetical protein FQA39_LY09219 [Lamprigera yunnana]|nr:hypothetical protein FQA39_LY09219 [Lamprigera yunnana]
MTGYTWVNSSVSGFTPANAVQAGTDSDGSKIYVGRSRFQNYFLPCKIVPQRREAYVAHSCKEHKVTNFQYLCEQKLQWVQSSNGHVPAGAVPGGHTSGGETLYLGRVHHCNAMTVGKVHPSHGCLYIPYGGNEISYKNYEVLVLK